MHEKESWLHLRRYVYGDIGEYVTNGGVRTLCAIFICKLKNCNGVATTNVIAPIEENISCACSMSVIVLLDIAMFGLRNTLTRKRPKTKKPHIGKKNHEKIVAGSIINIAKLV